MNLRTLLGRTAWLVAGAVGCIAIATPALAFDPDEGAVARVTDMVSQIDASVSDPGYVKDVSEAAGDLGFENTKDILYFLSQTRSFEPWLEEKLWLSINENTASAGGQWNIGVVNDGRGGVAAPPANDDCASATAVGVGVFPFDTTEAIQDGPASGCGSSAGRKDVWFLYTAPCTGTSSASTCGQTSLDTLISRYAPGCPAVGSPIACSDDACSSQSNLTWASTAGTTYLVRLFGWANAVGSGTITFACAGPPANDDCAGGTPVTEGSFPFTTASATTQAGVPAACDTNLLEEIWLNYTAGCTGEATIRTCPGGGAVGPDTVLQVYSDCSCPPAGSTIGCADDSGCGASGFSSSVLVPVTSGGCYKIRLSGWNGADVSGTLEISCAVPADIACCYPDGSCVDQPASACALAGGVSQGTGSVCTPGLCPAPPPNDNCANATPVFDGPNAFDRANATTDGASHPLPPCDFPVGDDQIHRDVWFEYTASCTGRVYVDTCEDGPIDTRLAVYDGCGVCPPAASPIACNDDSGAADEMTDPDQDPDLCNQGGGSPFESATRNQVVQGNCYLIRVGGFSAGSNPAGADVLTVTCEVKGACCLSADNSCVGGTIQTECDTLGGTFFPGQACDGLWACCMPDATCVDLDPLCCNAAGGTSYVGQVCVGNSVACCFGGTCQNLDAQCCVGSGGTIAGAACEGDVDGDLVDGECGDLCVNDPLKTAPGVCGCGVPDTDTDGDGTPDCVDGCPDDPDKTDPGICGCGVRDTDTDGDGTPDCNDGCPDDPNKTAPGICGCGVSDVDTDGDGTADCNDGCPNDPNKVAPGICGCGVADTDSDGDGTPNCNDGCPNDPNKVAPGICGCGVSDADNDMDGVANCNDGCPNDPNKTAPGVCGCGNPDTDSDNDTVLDCNDICPGADDTVDNNGNGVPDCTGEPIPTVNTWGLIIMGLLLITVGKVHFGRRRAITA